MPIAVTYQPSAYVIGNAAYQAGLGELEREQQLQRLRELQLALQQQSLAEERRQFDVSQQFRDRGLDLDALNQERQYALQQQELESTTDIRNRSLEADILNANRQAGLEAEQLRLNRSAMRQRAFQDANQLQSESISDFMNRSAQQATNAHDIWSSRLANDQRIAAEMQQAGIIQQSRIDEIQRQGEQEGLKEGTHYYTPEQQTMLRQLNESLARVQVDPRYSPEDRASATAMIQQQISAIRPLPVPADQQPLSTGEQYEKRSYKKVDPRTGKEYTLYASTRNGDLAESWMDPVDQGHLENDLTIAREEAIAKIKAPAEEAKRKNEEAQQWIAAQRDVRENVRERLDAMAVEKPTPEEYLDGSGNVTAEYGKAMRRWRAERDAIRGELSGVTPVRISTPEEFEAALRNPDIPPGTPIIHAPSGEIIRKP